MIQKTLELTEKTKNRKYKYTESMEMEGQCGMSFNSQIHIAISFFLLCFQGKNEKNEVVNLNAFLYPFVVNASIFSCYFLVAFYIYN